MATANEGSVHASTTRFQPMTSQAVIANFHSPRLQKKPDENVNIGLETYLNDLQLFSYESLDEEEKEEFIESMDALELFEALQLLNKEVSKRKLENYFLSEFLQKNDPRLLVGLKQRMSTSIMQRRITLGASDKPEPSPLARRASSKRSMMTTHSIFGHAPTKKGPVHYRLNFRAKADMADKAASAIERRVTALEATSIKQMKQLRARIEEAKYTLREARATTKNFNLHFLRDERDRVFLEKASERAVEKKFRKFIANWLKHGSSLVGTMRLKMNNLRDHCHTKRANLSTKSDLSGILCAIDFEQLTIKRDELVVALEDKNSHMAGLKAVTGRASLAMTEEKQIMMDIEDRSKYIQKRTVEVIKLISKMETESRYVENQNKRDLKTVEEMETQLELYDAPSVTEYIGMKNELRILEKDERILKRKLNLLQMTYVNNLKKFRLGLL